jgi:hypothetical protein
VRFISKDPFPGLFTLPQTQNPYPYVVNNPINHTDPAGEYLDSLIDIGFILYGLSEIGRNLYQLSQTTNPCVRQDLWSDLGWNSLALGADIGGLLLPMVTGAGVAVRSSRIGSKSRGNVFRSLADPVFDVLGPAKLSHPDEFARSIAEVKRAGISVKYRRGTFAYGPAPSSGKPGQLIIDPDASIGALRHEMQHARDDIEGGFLGMKKWFSNPDFRWELEQKAYQHEIDIAMQLGDNNLLNKILSNMENERFLIYGQ